MPNATITVTQTTGVTTTFTATHTTVQQLPAANILGIPPDLFIVFVAIIAIMVYAFFALQVKAIPVTLLYIRKNLSSLILRAGEDLEGVFLSVYDFKGKKIETLINSGTPIEVSTVNPRSKVYVIPRGRKGETLDQKTVDEILAQKYKVEEDKKNSKGARKAYVVERPEDQTKELAYVDASLGGKKMQRLYLTVQGTGQTVDMRSIVDGSASVSTGNTAIIHEERSAAKEFLTLLAAALRGTFSALLIPLLAGVSLGGMVVLLAVIFTGHFK